MTETSSLLVTPLDNAPSLSASVLGDCFIDVARGSFLLLVAVALNLSVRLTMAVIDGRVATDFGAGGDAVCSSVPAQRCSVMLEPVSQFCMF